MSPTSLIHNHRNGITSSTDLVNIMNTGNELYTALSRLSRQSYLLLTEVPEMITMFNSNYHPQYSISYTGNIRGSCAMEDFDYCMPLENAMQALIGQSLDSFLLTILSTIWLCTVLQMGSSKYLTLMPETHLVFIILNEHLK